MRTRLNCIRARRTWKRRWPTSCSERTCTMQSNSNRGRNCCTATQRETRAAWLFLLPSLTGVVLFVLLPFAETVRRSLFDTMGTAWVGLSNYRSVRTVPSNWPYTIRRAFWGFACRFFFQAAWYWRSYSTAVRCGKHGLPASSKPPFCCLLRFLWPALCCCGKPCLPGRGCATVG